MTGPVQRVAQGSASCLALRVLAGAVDAVFASGLLWVVTIITWPPDASGPDAGPWVVLSVLLLLLYGAVTEASAWQGTVGKRLLRLTVTDLQGMRIGLIRALARNAVKLVSSLPLGVGFLPAIFSDRRQTFYDRVAGCLVTR